MAWELDAFLGSLTAAAPATIDAYRRDLERLRSFLDKPLAQASIDELERYTATMRADGLSAATIARRTAAARSFFRHLQLLGARSDNPAAAVALPRRPKPLPKTLSPGEAWPHTGSVVPCCSTMWSPKIFGSETSAVAVVTDSPAARAITVQNNRVFIPLPPSATPLPISTAIDYQH